MKIVNNTKDYYRNATKQYLRVEDSKSVSYQHRLKDYWNTRIYQEYLDCTSRGGVVIFATFTYQDRFLPKYYYRDTAGKLDWFPCFSKRDKDRFLNSLRKRWERAGFTDNMSYKFNYIWPCEYGTTDGCTHRPHYHPMFFIPPEIVEYELGQAMSGSIKVMPEVHWKNLLRHYWTACIEEIEYRSSDIGFVPVRKYDHPSLGLVMWSPGQSIFVNSEFASLYCSKYMFKNENLLENEKVRKYYDTFGDLPSDGKKKGSFTNHWQGEKFGIGLVGRYSDLSTYIDGLNLNMSSELKKGKVIRHQCPPYIERKLLYDYDKTKNLYRLNAKGVQYKREKFKRKFDSLCARYKKYFNSEYIKASIGQFMPKDNTVLSEFSNIQELLSFLHNADSPTFVEEVVMYSRVWEGLLLTPYRLDKLRSCNHKEFLDLSWEQFDLSIAPHLRVPSGSDIYCEDGVFKHEREFGVPLCRSVFGVFTPVYTNLESSFYSDRFNMCSKFLDIVEEVDRIYLERCEKEYQNHLKNRKYLKMRIA